MNALSKLDLMEMFDIIEHAILLKRLEFYFEIREKAVTWQLFVPHYQIQVLILVHHGVPFYDKPIVVCTQNQLLEFVMWNNINFHCYSSVHDFIAMPYMGQYFNSN